MALKALIIIPLFVLGLAYILPFLFPHPGVEFIAYHPLPKPEFKGALEKNEKLTHIRRLGAGRLPGPEGLVFDKDGNLYTGTADGNIMRIFAKNESIEVYARVGGRPLGLIFDKNDNLIVCDALKGLISVHPTTRQVTVLASHVGDSPIFFADEPEIDKSGKIYFSDATNLGPVQHGNNWDVLSPAVLALIAAQPTGRILEYNPQTGKTRVVVDGLLFPNGVVLSKEEDYMLFAETGHPSIHRYYLSGPKAGKRDYLVENLPGYPDGVTLNPDGSIYVTFFSLRPYYEFLLPYPLHRRLYSLIPFAPHFPPPVGFIALIDKNGKIINTWWDPSGKEVHSITNVVERDGKLFMGSIANDFIAVLDL